MPQGIWYEIVAPTITLTQGDMLFGCPVLQWKADTPTLMAEGSKLQGCVEAISVDAVVMTQACDLENDKVTDVILCPHMSVSEYKPLWEQEMTAKGQNPTPKAWKKFVDAIADGYVWNLSILNAETIEGRSIEHRIVDFHDVYTCPRTFIESFMAQKNEPRFRLRPPYREHLSQAFARYFMRVGLPVGVAPVL